MANFGFEAKKVAGTVSGAFTKQDEDIIDPVKVESNKEEIVPDQQAISPVCDSKDGGTNGNVEAKIKVHRVKWLAWPMSRLALAVSLVVAPSVVAEAICLTHTPPTAVATPKPQATPILLPPVGGDEVTDWGWASSSWRRLGSLRGISAASKASSRANLSGSTGSGVDSDLVLGLALSAGCLCFATCLCAWCKRKLCSAINDYEKRVSPEAADWQAPAAIGKASQQLPPEVQPQSFPPPMESRGPTHSGYQPSRQPASATWERLRDPASQAYYYHDRATGRTSWYPPR